MNAFMNYAVFCLIQLDKIQCYCILHFLFKCPAKILSSVQGGTIKNLFSSFGPLRTEFGTERCGAYSTAITALYLATCGTVV